MKLTAHLKLLPTEEQKSLLLQTLQRANEVCNEISEAAWNAKTFRQFDIHRLTYHDFKDALPSNILIRCIAKVADAYKLDRKAQRVFRPTGAVAYNDRTLSWNLAQRTISILTLNGRHRVPFVCGERQWKLLQSRHGEADLAYVRGEFYLFATCDVEEPEPEDVQDYLGVDLGIVSLATDSDGETFSGKVVEGRRQWYQKRRGSLQSVGTRSAKRRLKKLSGRQRRFQKNENHRIAKQLVAKAERTKRRIALEDLKGIRARVRVKGPEQRARHSNWAFAQMRSFIEYKARLAGVLVLAVGAAYTSQTCNACGCMDKRNRPSQATFCCVSCSHNTSADVNAACNIRDRAVVNRPMVAQPLVAATSRLL